MGLGEIIIGIFAIFVGTLFCFQGNLIMRVLFPLMGFFAGFSAGAGMIAAITGDGFLSTVFGWIIGLFIGLLFGALAFFFYEFAVVLAFAGLGFAFTSGALAFLNLDWNWLVVILGTVVGLIFGIVAIAMQLPILILIIATAFFGSAIAIYGLMLVFNTVSLGDFSSGLVMDKIHDSFGLFVLWFGLGIAGSLSQTRSFGEEMQSAREYWESSATFSDYLNAQTKK